VFIAGAAHAFEPDGSLKDPRAAEQIRTLMQRLVHTTRALAPPPRPVPPG
jgi:hypothetical protein